MTSFKPGDKIRRISPPLFDPLHIITLDGIYTVRRLNPINTNTVFIEEDNAYISYDVDKFELVQEAPMFKSGDLARSKYWRSIEVVSSVGERSGSEIVYYTSGGWDYVSSLERVEDEKEKPVAVKKWVVGVIDNNGKSFDKVHDTQSAAAVDVEDLMELLGDDNRPLIRSIVIKREP